MEWIWMGGTLLLIKLNPTREVETGMDTETRIVTGGVIVIGVGIVTVGEGVGQVETVSNVESRAILLENAPLVKELEEGVVDMVEGMISMEVAVAMALTVMAISIVGVVETLVVTPAETLVATLGETLAEIVADQEVTNMVVIDLDLMSVLHQAAFAHDWYVTFPLIHNGHVSFMCTNNIP